MWLQFSDATADQIQYVDVDGDEDGAKAYARSAQESSTERIRGTFRPGVPG